MILQALVDYYEALAAKRTIERPGWSKADVFWALEIDENGTLLNVLPLWSLSEDGKKRKPRPSMDVPIQMKRSGKGAPSYFLCDNTKYFFGIENGKITEKSRRAFQQFKSLHTNRLSGLNTEIARSIVAYVNRYTPEDFLSLDIVKQNPALLKGNENCVFISRSGEYAQSVTEIKTVIDDFCDSDVKDEKEPRVYGTCMVTGKDDEIARIHNSVKGLPGNSPNGWTLISFDKDSPAYDSFGKKQGYNAPVGKYAAFAYVSALNHLLIDNKHKKVIGDTTVVYWAKNAEEQYQDSYSDLFEGNTVSDTDLDALMDSIAAGKPYDYNGLPLDPENDFYILGLSTNATRLSVRFFYQRSYREIVRNQKQHYEDIQIVSDGFNKRDRMSLRELLRETTRYKNSDGSFVVKPPSPLPQLAGDVMKSMMDGGRYPETLMNQTLMRIRTERDITRGKAGIIKAYLIRNTKNLPERDAILEVTQVSLNTESNYTPYVLGRLFAVLEGIQKAANRGSREINVAVKESQEQEADEAVKRRSQGINATIKDRFFSSACATPAAVFPFLMKLSNSHQKKLPTVDNIYWTKQIGELTEKLGLEFPAHLSTQEQGAFILGYYHQRQKQFEKKTNTDKEAE